MDVPARGRIPKKVYEAFHAAKPSPAASQARPTRADRGRREPGRGDAAEPICIAPPIIDSLEHAEGQGRRAEPHAACGV
ncbi:hypothetical protein STENM327S_01648 [Streptomyces tendae]